MQVTGMLYHLNLQPLLSVKMNSSSLSVISKEIKRLYQTSRYSTIFLLLEYTFFLKTQKLFSFHFEIKILKLLWVKIIHF